MSNFPAEMSVKTALKWTAFWVGLSLLFSACLYYYRGPEDALKFLAGYLIEYSLSVDNLFVFLLVFHYFAVPKRYMPGVLWWGILSAVLMRGIFIFLGLALVSRAEWVLYLFGVFLVISGVKFAFEKDNKVDPDKNPVLQLLKRYFPLTTDYGRGHFFVRERGVLKATPLFVALVSIETADLVFAIDSIPAVMSITLDPLLVYSSNIFAILGLRSLFFALSGVMSLFHYLHYGLAAILILIGLKMLIHSFWPIPIAVTLGTIGIILSGSVLLSLLFRRPTR